MSLQIINQIFAHPTKTITSTEKLILLALARFCKSGDIKAYRSLNDLARDTGFTKRCIAISLKSLRSKMILLPIESQTGFQTHSTVYMINLNKINGGERCSLSREPSSPIKEKMEPQCSESGSPHIEDIDNNIYIYKSHPFELEKNSHPPENHEEMNVKFEQWWNAYPRKQNKQKTFLAFCESLKHVEFEILLKKAKAYARYRERATENKSDQVFYTKMPYSWLNEWLWEDHYGKFEEENFYADGEGVRPAPYEPVYKKIITDFYNFSPEEIKNGIELFQQIKQNLAA